MLQQLTFKKIIPCLPRSYWFNWINHFSSDSIKDKSDNYEDLKAEQLERHSSARSYNTKEVSHLLEEAATFQDVTDKDWATTPYPKDIPIQRKEERTPKINPENTSVILFPGQGTIKVGMIKKYMNYPAAKDLFDIAHEITNFDLLKLCLNGPQEKLDRTEFNQAATVVSSLAALEKIRAETPKVFETCVATAGYSVGEISALVLSGAISFEDGVRLAWTRGKAMQCAANAVPQGMISIHCTSNSKVYKACQEAEAWARDLGVETPICRIAIFLHTERKILAGNKEALEYIERHKTEYNLTNVTKLPVSGAFHTPLMEPALKPVSMLLASIEIDTPRCQVLSNYRAVPYSDLRYMKKFILQQIVRPVKWEQCLQIIYNRPDGLSFPQTYDVASNGRMRAILKLVNAKAARSCTVI